MTALFEPPTTLWEHEQDFILTMIEMEKNGILLDEEFCREQFAIGNAEMARIERKLEFRPTSPKALTKVLLGDFGFPVVRRTEAGKPSFDKYAMEEYEMMLDAQGSDLAQDILAFRGYQKTTSSNYGSYLKFVSSDGRLRPHYKLHGARTGRMSCEDPNLQQIPKMGSKPWNGMLKRAFVARKGYVLLSHDYSQLEFRLAAHYAKDRALIGAFNDPERDVFWEMAENLNRYSEEGRQSCKTLTYAKLFGAGKGKIQFLLGEDMHSAHAFYDAWEKQYHLMVNLAAKVNAIAGSRGYIKYWSGRRRHLEKWESRKAFNSLIQGGGADVVKRAMNRVRHRVNNDDCRMVLQVHDALVHEVPEKDVMYWDARIREQMEAVNEDYPFKVHFAVSSEIWGDKEKTKALGLAA